ncbi:MAG: type II toxin-antitoxin system VapC family toxin [Thermoanaerobaculia bacterium]
MPSRVFVDSAFLIALINHRDRFHGQARILGDAYDKAPVLTTDAVLLEVGNALSRGFKHEASQVIQYLLGSEEAEIVRLDPALFDRAFDLYRSYRDKEWSLVDCISFVVMREAGVTFVLTSDGHFSQAGFQILMQEE